MQAIRLRHPAALTSLEPATLPDPGQPGPGEVLVRLRASSLNYHDYVVVTGGIRTPDGRIPLSDGAGEVLAAGPGAEFSAGTSVVSVFFPNWPDGRPVEGAFSDVPGDGADGFARELVVAPAGAFTRVPSGYSHAEAATLTCAALTAWRALVVEGGLKAGETLLVQGSGGVSVELLAPCADGDAHDARLLSRQQRGGHRSLHPGQHADQGDVATHARRRDRHRLADAFRHQESGAHFGKISVDI